MIKFLFRRWTWIALFWTWLSFTLGLSGLVDGLVKFHDSVEPMIQLYRNIKEYVIDLVPFINIPSFVFDYFMVSSGFLLMWRILDIWSIEKFGKDGKDIHSVGELMILTILWPFIIFADLINRKSAWIGKQKSNGNIFTEKDWDERMILIGVRYRILILIFGSAISFIFLAVEKGWQI